MEIYHFIIRLDEQQELTDKLADDIYTAGCDDSIVCSVGNQVFVEFDREARIYEEALASALEELSSIPYLFNKMSVVDEIR